MGCYICGCPYDKCICRSLSFSQKIGGEYLNESCNVIYKDLSLSQFTGIYAII